MKLHFLEKKYGIRINLLDWSGDDYETGTLNALIKIDRSDVGRALLESIAYHVKHHPGNLAKGILEIRPYAQGDCNASSDPDLTTKRGVQLKPVVHFWPKAYVQGGACSSYLERHRDEIGGILPDEALFHEFVHALRMASGKSTDSTHTSFTKGGLIDYDNEEEFIAVLVENIYITDPTNKPASTLRRDHASFRSLESDLDESFTFFRSSVSTYRLVEKFCKENPGFTKKLAKVKSSFNPVAAFYQDPKRARMYSDSLAARIRDDLGPEAWDQHQEDERKYRETIKKLPIPQPRK
jgi:hypothetical protein